MKQLQTQTSISALAHALHGKPRTAAAILPRRVVIDALTTRCRQALIDSYMRGGKIGARHVNEVL